MPCLDAVEAMPQSLAARYTMVRARMLHLIEGLSAEDLSAQSMPDASPAKWHLGHTSWFFEAMILSLQDDYQAVDVRLQQIFNSYYESLGDRVARCDRGLITRPSLAEVLAYRHEIDARMLERLGSALNENEAYLFELGLNHEQQHQELLIQDLIHLFSCNPLDVSVWHNEPRLTAFRLPHRGEVSFDEGVYLIGHDSVAGFAFDNEMPSHKQWLDKYSIACDLVTNSEWLSFVDDNAYGRAELWLADGWTWIRETKAIAPLYWRKGGDGQWLEYDGAGYARLDPDRPVRHISYYEADAFARWRGARLPTEGEWEVAAATAANKLGNLDTEVWQWTSSAYQPYPGFKPTEGTASEYNGKFMANQMVLRGGSYATSPGHSRITYRNFYYPHQRWAPSGLRLAFDMTTNAGNTQSDFGKALISGLSQSQKSISPKWLYDAEGSRLFEQITQLEEYYPTRQETALLQQVVPRWAQLFGDKAVLVELGSGASAKTRIVLDTVRNLSAYVPLDISQSQLEEAAAALRNDYPALNIVPILGDFENLPSLPDSVSGGRKIGFFPGSTIGNLENDEAVRLLVRMREILGAGSYFILGADLIKEEEILIRAYDDAQGVTADFNKNLLRRANSELGADFDLAAFDHRAVWNDEEARMEMHLVANRPTHVAIGKFVFRFDRGESIHTESSRKFDEARIQQLAKKAGWTVQAIEKSQTPSVSLALLRC